MTEVNGGTPAFSKHGTNSEARFETFAIHVDPETLRQAPFMQSIAGNLEYRLRVLADAISHSPIWASIPRSILLVRAEPDPVLGVAGYFDAADRARLEALQWQLMHVLPRLRYVGYERAQADCIRLAERLIESFGQDELRRSRFTAIPRGGLIVLGMLAYALDLQPSQLEPPYPPDAPLVLVDDCALSGVRFKQFLERIESTRVVFAHLYSPRGLRDAIEGAGRDEQRQVTCLSAHDLRDYAEENLGEEYDPWRQRWLQRMDGRGYWVGQPEQICFAWNEPDSGFWNPVTERDETGWRFVPPALCLKNQPAHDIVTPEVQVQPRGRGPLRPSPDVLFGRFEDQIAIGNTKTGKSYGLDGVGADMWRAIVESGDLSEASNTLAESYAAEPDILRADLSVFAEKLLAEGLLEKNR